MYTWFPVCKRFLFFGQNLINVPPRCFSGRYAPHRKQFLLLDWWGLLKAVPDPQSNFLLRGNINFLPDGFSGFGNFVKPTHGIFTNSKSRVGCNAPSFISVCPLKQLCYDCWNNGFGRLPWTKCIKMAAQWWRKIKASENRRPLRPRQFWRRIWRLGLLWVPFVNGHTYMAVPYTSEVEVTKPFPILKSRQAWSVKRALHIDVYIAVWWMITLYGMAMGAAGEKPHPRLLKPFSSRLDLTSPANISIAFSFLLGMNPAIPTN